MFAWINRPEMSRIAQKPWFFSFPTGAILILMAWILSACLIDPSGEFPLNDDWAYLEVVKGVLDEGKYRVSDWPAMTLWTHAWLGVMVCKATGGFSYTVLRLLVLGLGLLGVFLFGYLAKRISGKASLAFLCMAALAFNPLYFSLSFTYMTDVSFLFFFLLGVALYSKALDTDKPIFWVSAIIISIAGVLLRQFSLLLPVCFGATALLMQFNTRRLAWALSGVLFTWAALKIYTIWLSSVQPLPSAFGDLGNLSGWLNLRTLYFHFMERMGGFLFLLGLFLFPFHFLLLPLTVGRCHRLLLAIAGISAIGIALFFGIKTWNNALFGNIMYNFGLGPVVLKDYDMGIARGYNMPAGVWKCIRAAAILGSAALVFNLIVLIYSYLKSFSFNMNSTRALKTALALFGMGYFVFLFLGWANFDRYYLILVPCLALLILPSPSVKFTPWRALLVLLFYLPLFWFSVAGTHDYLAWNRARWSLLYESMEVHKISPTRIDGGFEFNATYKTGIGNPNTRSSSGIRTGISRWFVADDKYAVSTGEIPCYQPWKIKEYQSWTSRRKEYIFLLERPDFTRIDTFFFDGETLPDPADTLHVPPVRFGGNSLVKARRARSGVHAYELTPASSFGADSMIDSIGPCDWITISGWRWGSQPAGGIVAASPDQKEYYAFEIYPSLGELVEGEWHKVRIEISVPWNYTPQSLKFYLWNPTQETAWFDDLQVIRRRK